jgi:hypothetical protein
MRHNFRTSSVRSALLPALLLLFSAAAGCHGPAKHLALPPEQAQQLLLDRNWLDRLPETPSDRLHVFRFVPTMGGGVYQDRTLYAGQFELFTFAQDGQTVLFRLHHTDEEARVPYVIERIPSEEGSPFDLHLHLDKSPRGPSDYYNIRDSRADLHDPDQQLRQLWNTAAK